MASSPSHFLAPRYPLHDYQRQVLYDTLDALNVYDQTRVGERRVVAHLPTGAGKTRIACHAAACLMNQRSSEGKVVVWLASSEELCEQAAESLELAWSQLGNRDVSIHKYWGSHSTALDYLEEGFLVAGLPKLWHAVSRASGALAPLANDTAAVVFDEAHQAIAPTYADITERLLVSGPPLIGLTATPGRSHEVGEEDRKLSEMFNHKKVSIDPQGHDSAVTYLIRHDFLAEPEFVPIYSDLGIEVRDPASPSDYSLGDLAAIGKDEQRRELVASLVQEAVIRHRRTIVFCPSVANAIGSAEELHTPSLRTEAIVASTPSDERKKIIDDFRSAEGGPMVLFNYGVLTAGFDAPKTSCVIVARPTTSLVLYSQMVGRAMRGRRSGGNRTCTIYTVVDQSLPGFGSVVDAFAHWEELWRTQPSI